MYRTRPESPAHEEHVHSGGRGLEGKQIRRFSGHITGLQDTSAGIQHGQTERPRGERDIPFRAGQFFRLERRTAKDKRDIFRSAGRNIIPGGALDRRGDFLREIRQGP